MSTTKCPDCDHVVSELAFACVNCGRLTDYGIKKQENTNSSMWDVITRLRAPINVFAFAMMAAAAVFGMYSVDVMADNDLKAFAFSLHVFLAVAGMFFVTLLFCPGRIYHPNDLTNYDLKQDRPEIAAIIIVAMLVLYAFYQSYRLGGFACG